MNFNVFLEWKAWSQRVLEAALISDDAEPVTHAAIAALFLAWGDRDGRLVSPSSPDSCVDIDAFAYLAQRSLCIKLGRVQKALGYMVMDGFLAIDPKSGDLSAVFPDDRRNMDPNIHAILELTLRSDASVDQKLRIARLAIRHARGISP